MPPGTFAYKRCLYRPRGSAGVGSLGEEPSVDRRLCKLQGFRAVFVPQIMNWEALVSDKPSAWSPFVRDRDQERIMEAYHGSMERVASRKVWPTWLKC